MGITLISKAYADKTRMDITDAPYLVNIDDSSVREILLRAMHGNVNVITISDTLNKVQDELQLTYFEPQFRKTFIMYINKIILTTGEYPVTELAHNILIANQLSVEKQLTSVISSKRNFDPKEFIENAMKYMYTNEYPQYVDLSMSTGAQMLFRTDTGKLIPHCKRKFTKEGKCQGCNETCIQTMSPEEISLIREYLLSVTSRTKSNDYHNIGYTRLAYPLRDFGRLRVTIGTQRGTADFSIRKIPTSFIPLNRFFLSKQVEDYLLNGKPGLYLIVGQPMSGKTALMATIINEHIINKSLKVETLEYPIEYTFRHNKGIINQIEVGEDIATMEDAMRKLMTDNPDMASLTEIRDKNDIRTASYLANMNLKVFGTYHAASPSAAFKGVKNMLKEDEDTFNIFCNNLRAIIYQELIPNIKGGLTVAHGIFIRSDDILLTPETDASTIEAVTLRANTLNKHFLNDIYNLHHNKIISDETAAKYKLFDNKSIDYKLYVDGSPNASTMGGRL